MLTSYETLSCPVLLPGNPLADIGGTMQEYDAFGLTAAEKAHHLDIHQRHLVEVQHCPGAVALQLGFQGLKMLGLHVADEPERGLLPVSMPFNLARHLRCLFPVPWAVSDR